jgi:hypothetical protein
MVLRFNPRPQAGDRLEEVTPLPNKSIPLKGEVSNRSEFLSKKLATARKALSL